MAPNKGKLPEKTINLLQPQVPMVASAPQNRYHCCHQAALLESLCQSKNTLHLVKTNTNIIDHVQLYFLNNQPLWYHGIAVAIFFWHATAWHILLWCFSLLGAIWQCCTLWSHVFLYAMALCSIAYCATAFFCRVSHHPQHFPLGWHWILQSAMALCIIGDGMHSIGFGVMSWHWQLWWHLFCCPCQK